MPSPIYKNKKSMTVKVKSNKRKTVVKVKNKTTGTKSKAVTDKKTGVRTKTTTSGKGKNKTKTTKVSAEGIMPMLRKIAPDSPTARKMQTAIRQKPITTKMAPRAKKSRIKTNNRK